MTHNAMNPALLARATPGERVAVGEVYAVSAAWLQAADNVPAELATWLPDALARIGATLRNPAIKRPADPVYQAALIHEAGTRVARATIGRRYGLAALWLSATAGDALPADLAQWLAVRLARVGAVIRNPDVAKPAAAVYQAVGAGRTGKLGNLPASSDTVARDCMLAWEVEYQRRLFPDRPLGGRARVGAPDPGIFHTVAGLWSMGREQLSASVVEDAWKRRATFGI